MVAAMTSGNERTKTDHRGVEKQWTSRVKNTRRGAGDRDLRPLLHDWGTCSDMYDRGLVWPSGDYRW